ncbi:MAG: uroporphyrinogen decarboxylase [Vampirovibrionales bacterium]
MNTADSTVLSPSVATPTGLTGKRLLDTLRGHKSERPPVWLMRQAGRYLPEYQAVRQGSDFLTMCKRPELAMEITMQPIRRYGMDGSIVFSDILIPLEAMGMSLQFIESKGPVFQHPIRTPEALKTLRPFVAEEACAFLGETLQGLRESLPKDTTLLGFAGAPWTLASYAIEGESIKQGRYLKHWVYNYPEALHALLLSLSDMLVDYLSYQVQAGAEALQVFDSWGGMMPPAVYQQFIAPYQTRVIQGVKARHPEVPVLLFVKHSRGLLPSMAMTGADGLSLDELTTLTQADAILSQHPDPQKRQGVLQGNLDPLLLATAERPSLVAEATRAMLDTMQALPRAYVANLGHGVLPFTPVENVQAFVETVQQYNGMPQG